MSILPDCDLEPKGYTAADAAWWAAENSGCADSCGPGDRPPPSAYLIGPVEEQEFDDLAEQARWDDLMSRGFLPY